jgi:hypothetical protein
MLRAAMLIRTAAFFTPFNSQKTLCNIKLNNTLTLQERSFIFWITSPVDTSKNKLKAANVFMHADKMF